MTPSRLAGLARLVASEPSGGAKLLARLLALALTVGGRRFRARYEWHPRVTRARYRINTVRHPLHQRIGLPGDSLGCPCDDRLGVRA